MSIIVPKRIDRCANSPKRGGACLEWAVVGEFFCGEACRKADAARVETRLLGGSLDRWMDDHERDHGVAEESIGATRQPRLYTYDPPRVKREGE